MALELWDHVVSMGGWLRATWLPRDSNQVSDMLSKGSILTWEFTLDQGVLERLWSRWFTPEVDCFASSRFHSLPGYFSFHPDSNALRRDAFSVTRWPSRVYAFPPVPLIPMTLDKIRADRVRAILIVPHSNTAKWWDMLLELLLEPPVKLGDHRILLTPLPGHSLPYLGTLSACLVQGSCEARTLMDNDIRPGTKKVYQSRIGAFQRYCEDIGCDAATAPVEIVANFLAILCETMKYSYQTICGYRNGGIYWS